MEYEKIEDLPKEKMLELIDIYAKNWLAMDGVWFLSVEAKHGMDEAMEHDINAWKSWAAIEARRIKAFLELPEEAGLDGLRRALEFRFYGILNRGSYKQSGNELVYTVSDCRVQTARARKGLPYHPCKPVGIVDYGVFSKVIDPRITVECVSCYPDVTDTDNVCVWKFILNE